MTEPRPDIVISLREFVLGVGTIADPMQLTADSGLYEEGYLDSVGMIMFMTKIEDLLGRSLEETEMVFPNFRSINAVISTFFSQ